MIKFKLPKLHLGVSTNKNLEDWDPKKFVNVINGYAIVSDGLTVICDLRQYIKDQCKIDDDQTQLKELDNIIEWMDGKSFDSKLWQELTSEQFVSLLTTRTQKDEKGLQIHNNKFLNKLVYMDPEVEDKEDFLKDILNKFKNEKKSIQSINLKYSRVKELVRICPELSSDSIFLEFSGNDVPVKFIGIDKPYFLGYIPASNDEIMFSDQGIEQFIEDTEGLID